MKSRNDKGYIMKNDSNQVYKADEYSVEDLSIRVDDTDAFDNQDPHESEFEAILRNSENTYDHGNDLLYQYFSEVGKYPLLTPEEELQYGRLAQKEDINAINRLMQGNLRLVIMFAKRYEYRGLELADLISEGNLGLRHAVDKYDPDRNFRFSTYAVWWIRYYIETAIMNQGRTVRVPIHINKAIAKLVKVSRTIAQEKQWEATISELSEATGFTLSEVMDLMANNESSVSLDGLIKREDSRGLHDVLPDESANDLLTSSLDSEVFSVLENVIGSLTEAEQMVIHYRFGINGQSVKTLDETGEAMDLTRDQVRYLQVKTLEKLRAILEEKEIALKDLLTE